MSKRIISGVIGAFFTLFILFFDQKFPSLLSFIISIIAILSINEIFSVMNTSNNFEIIIPSVIFVAIYPIFKFSTVWQFSWYFYSLWMFAIMILRPNLKLKIIAVTYTMSILISLSLGTITELKDYGKEFGTFYVLLALAIAWMSDTGAYFCGKYFGKNKLCPQISPKKTIEGFIGGIIVCLLSVILLSFIFNDFVFAEKRQINYVLLIILSLSGSAISALGDLCFSSIKRQCEVKDFGFIMPGHGGILDRFDSVIFTAPYVFLFIKTISIAI